MSRSFHGALRGKIRQAGNNWEAYIPGREAIAQAYREACETQSRVLEEVVSIYFSPVVAQVGRVSGQLAKFQKAYLSVLADGQKPLHRSRSFPQPYIDYLYTHDVIDGGSETGYRLSHSAVKYLENFDKRFPAMALETRQHNPIPFLSLCLENHHFLSEEMHLTHPKTYFRLMHAIFEHQFYAANEGDAPQDHPVSLASVAHWFKRNRRGRQTEDALRDRMAAVVATGAVEELDADAWTYSLKPAWFEGASEFARTRFSQQRLHLA